MKIKKLSLLHFRCYDFLEIYLNEKINIFIGNNAQGKTSVLESIYFLSFTKSHKTTKDQELILNNSEFAKINSLIDLKDDQVELGIVLSKIGKKAKYNQIEIQKLSEYIGMLNVVMFSPEDLELIKSNPGVRRKFIDSELGQLSKSYVYHLQNYRKILKQRNDLLKTMQQNSSKDYLLLDVITEQMIEYQLPIMKERQEFINKIEELSQKEYKRLSESDDLLEITYIPSMSSNLYDEYQMKYKFDIITGTTNLGVHRDELLFSLNKHPLKSRGSQGEQRTAILAIKIALVELIYQTKNEYPILLLDDVLSELDHIRQNKLLDFIKKDIQVLLTSTTIDGIDLNKLSNYQVFQIDNREIKECDNNGKQL